MLSCLLLCAVLAMRGFPETPAARWCAEATEATVAAVRRIERKHVIFVLLMTVILVAGAELLAIGGPLDAGLVMMWDVSAFVDALLAAATLAAVARTRSGWRFVLQRLAPRRPGALRRKRTPVRPTESTPANDDEDHRWRAHAA